MVCNAKKFQLCVSHVTYLGYNLEGDKQILTQNLISMILYVPMPNTKKQAWGFLGALGYCPYGYPELAKALYASTGDTQLLQWIDSKQRALGSLKKVLISALAITLLDNFSLFMNEA